MYEALVSVSEVGGYLSFHNRNAVPRTYQASWICSALTTEITRGRDKYHRREVREDK